MTHTRTDRGMESTDDMKTMPPALPNGGGGKKTAKCRFWIDLTEFNKLLLPLIIIIIINTFVEHHMQIYKDATAAAATTTFVFV